MCRRQVLPAQDMKECDWGELGATKEDMNRPLSTNEQILHHERAGLPPGKDVRGNGCGRVRGSSLMSMGHSCSPGLLMSGLEPSATIIAAIHVTSHLVWCFSLGLVPLPPGFSPTPPMTKRHAILLRIMKPSRTITRNEVRTHLDTLEGKLRPKPRLRK